MFTMKLMDTPENSPICMQTTTRVRRTSYISPVALDGKGFCSWIRGERCLAIEGFGVSRAWVSTKGKEISKNRVCQTGMEEEERDN